MLTESRSFAICNISLCNLSCHNELIVQNKMKKLHQLSDGLSTHINIDIYFSFKNY